jgi:hypothetical protein
MIKSSPKPVHKVIIPLFLLVWISMIGAAVLGLTTLLSPGKIETDTNRNEQSVPTLPEVTTDLELSTETSEESVSEGLSFLTLLVLLLACSGGSLLVTFILRYLVTSQPPSKGKKKVNKTKIFSANKRGRKFLAQKVFTPTAEVNSEVVVTVIAPQESTPVERRCGAPTLAETLDLRKRQTLMSIMQDN